MNSREDDDIPYDSDDNDPVIRELRIEMVRLEAQLDQLLAAARERAEEVEELRARLAELETIVQRLRERYERDARTWGWITAFAGAVIGIWLSWLLRQW